MRPFLSSIFLVILISTSFSQEKPFPHNTDTLMVFSLQISNLKTRKHGTKTIRNILNPAMVVFYQVPTMQIQPRWKLRVGP
jgi:hypothetical protein